ncbi:hypothetical protein ACFL6S_00310 [Candidatus Poribacteria bacterium]
MNIPTVKFGEHEITRLIIGGNPFCGGSHFSSEMSQDMIDYYTPEKVAEVLAQCEELGINTVQARGDYHRIMYSLELFRRNGGNLQWIAQTASEMHDIKNNIQVIAAFGAIGIYFHGSRTDNMWHEGNIDGVEDYLKVMRDCGVQVGLGTHIPEVIEYVEDKDWDVDFYMACVYNLNRQIRESAIVSGIMTKEKFYEEDPPRMCEVIRAVDKPCLAFKILASSRRCSTQEDVKDSFKWAFDNIKPTDAVVVGMFPKYVDQVRLNIEYTMEALERAETSVQASD